MPPRKRKAEQAALPGMPTMKDLKDTLWKAADKLPFFRRDGHPGSFRPPGVGKLIKPAEGPVGDPAVPVFTAKGEE